MWQWTFILILSFFRFFSKSNYLFKWCMKNSYCAPNFLLFFQFFNFAFCALWKFVMPSFMPLLWSSQIVTQDENKKKWFDHPRNSLFLRKLFVHQSFFYSYEILILTLCFFFMLADLIVNYCHYLDFFWLFSDDDEESLEEFSE